MSANQERGFSESGLWVPADASGAGLVFTNLTGNCRYLRIGDLVVCFSRISYPVNASGASASFSGLPFSSKATTNSVANGTVWTDSGLELHLLVSAGGTTVFIYGNAGIQFTNTQLSGKDVRATVIYEAA
jgi:hypothetical protein